MPTFRIAIASAAILAVAAVLGADVGVTDGPKSVVVNTRNGKAYAAFPDLGVVKIVNGATGAVVVLKTGANVKDLSINPRDGRVYAKTNMIYVANRLSDKVTAIDGRTNVAIQR